MLGMLAISYFGSLSIAASRFPHPYDWRRNVISNLLSPRDNPGWYWLPSIGVATAGLCMLLLAAWFEGRIGDGSRAGRMRRGAFLVGSVCLILAAVVAPQHTHRVIGFRHLHEILARTSAAGLGIGMLGSCASMGRQVVGDERRRVLQYLWRVTTLPPVLGAVGSGLLVALASVGESAQVAGFLRGTPFWHLAFWEWVGSVSVFLFFTWPVLLLDEN